MKIREVDNALLEDLGLTPPDLEMLQPTAASYTCLLLQPSGPIFASEQRIGGLDQALNEVKALEFLRLAKRGGAGLAVAPEYFVPWSSLGKLLAEGTVPGPGSLWVLGFESITLENLAALQAELKHACDFVYEPAENLPADRALLDPVVLLFNGKKVDASSRLVALVQFKTLACRDNLFEEEALLKRGATIYQFRGVNAGPLTAAVIICSDAFSLSDAIVPDLVDRGTLIHIQLNPDPRNQAYRQYRKTAFELDDRASDCHIVCLNWARTIALHHKDGSIDPWPPVGCSTWYCSNDACSPTDDIVVPNQGHGVYYAYMEERRHALLLDYDEAVFELRVPKVMTKGKGVIANKNGPNTNARYVWNTVAGSWEVQSVPPSHSYDQLIGRNADAQAALVHVHGASAVDIERLLALSAASISGTDGWLVPKAIDAFVIGPEEIVKRVTVAQDAHEEAQTFRERRLNVMANLRKILNVHTPWPPQLVGLDQNAEIRWSKDRSSFNVWTKDGVPSLVTYLDLEPDARTLENKVSMLINLVRRAEENDHDRRRIALLYRKYGELTFAEMPGLTRYDDAQEDETDLAAVDTSSVFKED
jgi:hypothetical protein